MNSTPIKLPVTLPSKDSNEPSPFDVLNITKVSSDSEFAFGIDIIPDSIKRFKPNIGNVLVAVLQEASVMTFLNHKIKPDASDLQYLCTMLVVPDPNIVDSNLKPGDIIVTRTGADGRTLFGSESYIGFLENEYTPGSINRTYLDLGKEANNGVELTDKQILAKNVPFDLFKRERTITYYCIPSHFIHGAYPEEYNRAFSISPDNIQVTKKLKLKDDTRS